ncbi:hypothetical protein OROHE_022790 [Orobanche hederae]
MGIATNSELWAVTLMDGLLFIGLHDSEVEKMVAALIASGASPGAVTDPNSQDFSGKTPASIAVTYGHRGLAGYLSEVALTSHLSSLTLVKSEVKSNKVCWAVGILEKVILRWRRRGVGLRGFRLDSESIEEYDDEDEEEDILKVFRKQKVDNAIDEAVARVLSMVESPTARQQYHRVLEKYRQTKGALGTSESSTAESSSHLCDTNISSCHMDNDGGRGFTTS